MIFAAIHALVFPACFAQAAAGRSGPPGKQAMQLPGLAKGGPFFVMTCPDMAWRRFQPALWNLQSMQRQA